MQLLVSTMLHRRSGLVDESLSLLAVLALCEEGANAIIDASILLTLVELLCTGTPKSREHALAVLLALCQGGDVRVFNRVAFYNHRIVSSLCSLLTIGSDRAKRKAKDLMNILVVSDSSGIASGSSFSTGMSSQFYRSASFDCNSNPSSRP